MVRGRSVENFFSLYQPIADEWTLFDNSIDGDARPVASHNGNEFKVEDEPAWQRMQRLAAEKKSLS
jgi:hypothetical protein